MKNKLFSLFIILIGVTASHTSIAQVQPAFADTIIDGKKCVYPSFKGGLNGWRKYLEGNLRYPKKAVKQKIEGLVRIEITVDAKGHITDIAALNDPGGGLSEEAVRVLKDGPNWIPATIDGQPASFKFVQSITFALK